MTVIRTQAYGGVLVLTHDDGSLSTLPRVAGGWQGGQADAPGPGPGPTPTVKFIWPFSLNLVTSEFGPRNGRLHAGIDFGNGIANQSGADIKCSAPGKVIVANKTNSHGGYGNAVVVDHGGGLCTLYGHMRFRPNGSADVDVNVGQTVTQGQRLGGVGQTGASFGNHLHFETHEGGYRWNASARNPRLFFRKYN